jgi:hypothetical protein
MPERKEGYDMTEKQGDTGDYGKIMEDTGASMECCPANTSTSCSQTATSRQPKQSSTN